jgi:hypothetical protein
VTAHDLGGDARSVLQEGRVAYVAVTSRRGPHVVPFLYAASGDRLWFIGAADTLTVRLAEPSARAGVLVRAGARDVVLSGTLHRIDPLRVPDLVAAGRRLLGAPTALARYAVRNAPDLLAFVRDAARGRAGSMPPTHRALLAFDPDRHVVVDGDEPVSPVDQPPASRAAGRLATPAASTLAAVLGAGSDDGPVALPVRWDAARRRGWVSTALSDSTGITAGAGSITVDAYGAPGPAAKSGRLVRGELALHEAAGRWREFGLDPDRVTRWSGVDTATRRPA